MIKRSIELTEEEYGLLGRILHYYNYAARTYSEIEMSKNIKKQLGCYPESEKMYLQDNYFPGKLSLGNGDASIIRMNDLHRRLDYALVLLGGIQQSETKENIKKVIFDICRALDEKEIENAATMQEVMK